MTQYRFTRLYFLTLADHQFRLYFKKAQKNQGNPNDNISYFLEARLLPLFYRTSFLSNPFIIINFIKNNNVLINFIKINFCNALIKLGSLLHLKKN